MGARLCSPDTHDYSGLPNVMFYFVTGWILNRSDFRILDPVEMCNPELILI